MFNELAVSDHNNVWVLSDLSHILEGLVHFCQMSPVVCLRFEAGLIFFVETKNRKNIWFCKSIFVQVLDLVVWDNFDGTFVEDGMSLVLGIISGCLNQGQWVIVMMVVMMSSL